MLGFGRIFCIFISFAWASFARSYIVDGLVVAVNPPSFTVAHRPISGYMEAMTMDVHAVSAGEVERLRVGMRVRFELRDKVARNLRIVPADEKDMPAPARQPAIGQAAPDFNLIDEHRHDVTLRSFRGKLVALNFIYTRCPMPEVCPRLAANFATLQRRFREAMGRDLILLSITIDPQWDNPDVLAAYAKLWRAREDSWRFLTGSPEAVRHAATDWGLVYWPEDGAIVHTSRTALIGRDGKLLAVVEGSSFRTDQLIALIQRHLEVK